MRLKTACPSTPAKCQCALQKKYAVRLKKKHLLVQCSRYLLTPRNLELLFTVTLGTGLPMPLPLAPPLIGASNAGSLLLTTWPA
jgi:hypothetical protein